MAVGKLTVTPISLRKFPSNLSGTRLFFGCFVNPIDKHRTHSQDGPEPRWQDELICDISENDHILTLELVDENSPTGLVAHGEVALDKVFNQEKDSTYVQLKNLHNQPYCEVLVNLFFSTNTGFDHKGTMSSVSSSFSKMNIYGDKSSLYPTSSTYSQTITTSHNFPSQQSSVSSLGPAKPVPENYGAGTPPPFTPPPPAYSQDYVSASSSSGTNLPDVSKGQEIDYSKIMTREQFEKEKEKGTIPKWAKYVGAAVAVGVGIYVAHELKEHHDKKKKEKEKHKHKHKHESTYNTHHGYPEYPTGLHGQGNLLSQGPSCGRGQGRLGILSRGAARKQERLERKAEKHALRMQKREMRRHRRHSSSSSSSSSDSD